KPNWNGLTQRGYLTQRQAHDGNDDASNYNIPVVFHLQSPFSLGEMHKSALRAGRNTARSAVMRITRMNSTPHLFASTRRRAGTFNKQEGNHWDGNNQSKSTAIDTLAGLGVSFPAHICGGKDQMVT